MRLECTGIAVILDFVGPNDHELGRRLFPQLSPDATDLNLNVPFQLNLRCIAIDAGRVGRVPAYYAVGRQIYVLRGGHVQGSGGVLR